MRKQVHFYIFYGSLMAAVATLPVTYKFTLPIAVLLLVNWIAEWNWKEKVQRIKNSSYPVLFYISVSFFLIYVIGLFYSSNKTAALSDLEYKIWFLVSPLIFFTADPQRLTKKRIHTLFYALILSSIALIILNYVIAFIHYLVTKDILEFFYARLSHFMHPSYSALHITTAFLTAFYLLFIYKEPRKLFVKIFLGMSLLLFAVYIVCLQSKAGLLVFVVLLFILGLYLINQQQKRVLLSIVFIVAMLVSPMVLGKFIHLPVNRFKASIKKLEDPKNMDDPQDGTWQRIAIWKASRDVALEHLPFGTGTGDVKENLTRKYKEYGYTYIYTNQSNSHNQYLQTFIALGIPGLLILLAYFLCPLFVTVKKRELLYFCFIITVMLNLLVESMFERRAGCDFVALFNGLFCFMMLFSDKKIFNFNHNEESLD